MVKAVKEKKGWRYGEKNENGGRRDRKREGYEGREITGRCEGR